MMLERECETRLTAAQEAKFRHWKAIYAPDDSGEDYDLRGAFLDGARPDPCGHWPDRFKKPNHPSFSVESIYAAHFPHLAGRWDGDVFIAPEERRPD
jgi:hypothetical protein